RDLLKFSKIALADPSAVPVGIYAKKWLEMAGGWKAVADPIVPTLDVRAAPAPAPSGSAQAPGVYTTDARNSHNGRTLCEAAGDPGILYAAAPLARAGKAAADFAAFLQGKEASAVFSRAGFVVIAKK